MAVSTSSRTVRAMVGLAVLFCAAQFLNGYVTLDGHNCSATGRMDSGSYSVCPSSCGHAGRVVWFRCVRPDGTAYFTGSLRCCYL